jgi:U3 small nucleolar RNA-associated protein 20
VCWHHLLLLTKPLTMLNIHMSSCFCLCRWRELNTTTHWLDVERVVRPLSQSLPLLLLHKQQVLQALLQGLLPSASPSLPPLFALLVAAARDLQEELVPLLPAVWAR